MRGGKIDPMQTDDRLDQTFGLANASRDTVLSVSAVRMGSGEYQG